MRFPRIRYPSLLAATLLVGCAAPPPESASTTEAASANCRPPSLSSEPSNAPFAQVGGSNFIAYDTAGYRGGLPQTDSSGFKSPIAMYDQDPGRVQRELQAMFANGQRRIALFLWYAPELAKGPATSDVSGEFGSRGFATSSAGGVLMPQHQENLQKLLCDIASTGYREVQFRFAGMASANPHERTSWSEDWYQSNWNFIASTITLVNGALAGTGVTVTYDLEAELFGSGEGITRAYGKRLWQDFSYAFPTSRSYGFTVTAGVQGALAGMIRMFDETGRRPSEYAFDVYDKPGIPNVSEQIGYIVNDLKAMGDLKKPLLVQETSANDYNTLKEISVWAPYGVNFRAIMQWPLAPDSPDRVTSMDFAENYHAYLTYLPAPTIDAAGTGCSDSRCLWINARSVESTASVDVRSRASGALLHSYSGGDLVRSVSGDTTTLTLRLATVAEVAALGSGGLSVYVVNPDASKWSNPANVP